MPPRKKKTAQAAAQAASKKKSSTVDLSKAHEERVRSALKVINDLHPATCQDATTLTAGEVQWDLGRHMLGPVAARTQSKIIVLTGSQLSRF